MLFFDQTWTDRARASLREEMSGKVIPIANPLPCDRWIARSALQKAIRRADAPLAQRALANLFAHDRRAIWRHLTIIALEDVGMGEIETLQKILAAQRDRAWREDVGGEWAVMAELVRRMAVGDHCQAICDLLLRATNDPALRIEKDGALHADMFDLATSMMDADLTLVRRGITVLAIGGGLAPGQQFCDPKAVLELMQDALGPIDILEVAQAAWGVSRNPMALLLPLVWERWAAGGVPTKVDDLIPPVQLTSGIPGYALDQFTRRGNAVSRTLLAECHDVRELLDDAGIRRGDQVSTVGDLIFLNEGGVARNRLTWGVADQLRLPHRWLPAAARLGSSIGRALRLVDAKGSQIAKLRHEHLSLARID